jgi:hypothetical protein
VVIPAAAKADESLSSEPTAPLSGIRVALWNEDFSSAPPIFMHGARTLNPKTIVIAQFFISGMMAFMMTGFFGFLHLGLTSEWVREWANSFVIAWPVAFVLSLGVGKVGFMIASRITGETA